MPTQPEMNLQRGVRVLAVTYVVLWLALWYLARVADVLGGASLWFLPAGLRFFSFVLFGWPALVLELVVILISSLAQIVVAAEPLPGLLSAQMGWLVYDWIALPLAYAAVLFPLRQSLRARLDLAVASHCAVFIGVAIAAATVGAMVGTIHLVFAGFVEPSQWRHVTASWFTGDFIGIITLTPFLLVCVWPRLVRRFGLWHWSVQGAVSNGDAGEALPAALREGLNSALVALLSVLLVFGIPSYLDLNLQAPIIALLLLVPLAGVALRYGLSGAVLAVVVLDSGVVMSVVLLKQQNLTLQYQLVMVAIALVGLWLGGVVKSRNRLLENYNRELIAEVAQQTLALQQANRELAVKEQHLQLVLTAAPVGVLEFDRAGYCRYLNNIASVLTHCTQEQAIGQHVLDFVHPDERDKVGSAWHAHALEPTVQTLEVSLKNQLWCTAHWINLSGADASAEGAILVLTDSTVHRQQQDRLWTLGHHDFLTALPNRRLFLDRCEQALSLAHRRGDGAAVLCLDLDGFKRINDNLGHAAGDALLQQVAQRLKLRIRDSDTLARIGGDEFAVVVVDVKGLAATMQFAQALVDSLNEPFALPQGRAQVSCSVGVALYPEHAVTVEMLTECADAAMYSAKRAGKNQVQTFRGQASGSGAG
jgi:diguanylate cyclase (GGDEF)-like protein